MNISAENNWWILGLLFRRLPFWIGFCSVTRPPACYRVLRAPFSRSRSVPEELPSHHILQQLETWLVWHPDRATFLRIKPTACSSGYCLLQYVLRKSTCKLLTFYCNIKAVYSYNWQEPGETIIAPEAVKHHVDIGLLSVKVIAVRQICVKSSETCEAHPLSEQYGGTT